MLLKQENSFSFFFKILCVSIKSLLRHHHKLLKSAQGKLVVGQAKHREFEKEIRMGTLQSTWRLCHFTSNRL